MPFQGVDFIRIAIKKPRRWPWSNEVLANMVGFSG
jgi:hypothetical protein